MSNNLEMFPKKRVAGPWVHVKFTDDPSEEANVKRSCGSWNK